MHEPKMSGCITQLSFHFIFHLILPYRDVFIPDFEALRSEGNIPKPSMQFPLHFHFLVGSILPL